MAAHSIVLACRIPGTGEPGGLPSMGSHRVGHDWSDLAAAAVYICQSQSPKSSHRPSNLGNHKFVLYICDSISVLQISSSLLYFQSPYISDIIQYFSLSNLPCSVWQSLSLSMSLQVVLFHFFLWLNNIPLYICTTTSTIGNESRQVKRIIRDYYKQIRHPRNGKILRKVQSSKTEPGRNRKYEQSQVLKLKLLFKIFNLKLKMILNFFSR